MICAPSCKVNSCGKLTPHCSLADITVQIVKQTYVAAPNVLASGVISDMQRNALVIYQNSFSIWEENLFSFPGVRGKNVLLSLTEFPSARFIRAVSELEFLGFIKPTKQKTDHVARLTWGSC